MKGGRVIPLPHIMSHFAMLRTMPNKKKYSIWYVPQFHLFTPRYVPPLTGNK
jgi:hypothetical protein